MYRNDDYATKINGPVSCVQFEDFKQRDHISPDLRVYEFMVLGPFVLETDGMFETEYFYERHKILDCDYLVSSGGEANQIPYLGKAVKNDYYGKEYLQWQHGIHKWDMLRFDEDDSDCNDALFVTEQRNCVYYAASYVECEEEIDAILCYENSGCKLFLNGALIHNNPYGRVKGIASYGNCVAVHFQKGKNLLLFKLRTGYIADTIDISMTNCSIYPIAVKAGNMGVSYLQPTAVYLGSKDQPRQIFQCFAGAFTNTDNAEIHYTVYDFHESFELKPMTRGECKYLRIQVPVKGKAEAAEIQISLQESHVKMGACIQVETLPFCGYDGVEHAFSDFHFDTTYHQEQRVYALGALHITKCMIDKMIKDPNFKSILSEIDYLHPYYSIYPKHRSALKKAFETGRAEADCFFNQPNELTSSPEGLTRNLIYGQLYHRDVLGKIVTVYAPGDVFGHPNQISQICAKGGCHALRWGKLIWGVDNIFRHLSPDGTVLVHDKGIDKADAIRLGLKNCSASSQVRSTVPAFPLNENTEWMKDTVNHTQYSVFSEMLGGIIQSIHEAEKDGGTQVDLTSRDLTQHHSGVLLTRTDFKQANRLAENLLITAEKFSAIAAYYGAEYPEKALDKAWRQLLCAQHHDSITGTNNEISFVDLMLQYRESVELAADIVKNATAFLASGIVVEDGEYAYFVFNPHSWDRVDYCEILLPENMADDQYILYDDKGNEYDYQIIGKTPRQKFYKATFIPRVPSMGYATFTLKESISKHALIKENTRTIENEFYSVTVDADLGGGIVSIIDRECNKEVVNLSTDGPANRVVVLREVPDRMETQHEIYTTGHKLLSSDYKAKVQSEKCGVYERLIVTVKLDIVANIRQEITLYQGVKRIDIKTTVEDYQGKDDLFTVTFPVNVKGGRPIYDDRFAPHVCSQSQKKLSFQTHQYASFSHSRIAPVNQWLEFGRTVFVEFREGTTVMGELNIGMTALIRKEQKGLVKAADALLCALTKKAIPVTTYPDGLQHGGHKVIHFNEDLDNTDTRFVLCVEGDKNAYEKKLFVQCKASVVSQFNDHLQRNKKAILFTRDSDNHYKKSIDVILIKASNIEVLNEVIGDISRQLSDNNKLVLHDVILDCNLEGADNYGVALLNKGTICCSVEPNSLMNMMLFHTADFYGNSGKTTKDKELIPEQKTHVFRYALYPHAGDYREAHVYQKGLDFNDPLICAKDVYSKGMKFLPKSKSFLKCNDGFILTLMKAGGYPIAAMKSRLGTIMERGLALRGFEPHGKNGKAIIEFGFDIDGVNNVNLLEEENRRIYTQNNVVEYRISPHSIESFHIKIKQNLDLIGNMELGAKREVVEPTYVRSWEHDSGSMPMGYMSVAGIISKEYERIEDSTYRLTVSMANNQPDTAIQGTMRLMLSPGFTAGSMEIPYSVKPGGIAVYPVVVTKPDKDARGILRLQYTHDGQCFEDIFEFGSFNPEMELKIQDSKLIASVYNPTCEDLYGEIAIAAPFETWDAYGFNSEAWGDISPRTQKFEVKAGKRKDYVFRIRQEATDLFNAYWAVVKLMANGRIHFAYAREKGPRHNVWAHEFYQDIRKNNGSLADLLKM